MGEREPATARMDAVIRRAWRGEMARATAWPPLVGPPRGRWCRCWGHVWGRGASGIVGGVCVGVSVGGMVGGVGVGVGVGGVVGGIGVGVGVGGVIMVPPKMDLRVEECL